MNRASIRLLAGMFAMPALVLFSASRAEQPGPVPAPPPGKAAPSDSRPSGAPKTVPPAATTGTPSPAAPDAPAQAHAGVTPAPEDPALHQKLMRQADGWQPGKVHSLSGQDLHLRPHEAQAGMAHFQLEPGAPVYGAPQGRASLASLRSGSDVKVYFKQRPGAPPLVVAVVLLDAESARRYQSAGQPAQKLRPAGRTPPPAMVPRTRTSPTDRRYQPPRPDTLR